MMDSAASDSLPQTQAVGSPAKQLACKQCRARKVKCDRRPSGCMRCERLDFVCSYTTVNGVSPPEVNTSSHELTQAGTKRRRISHACAACRATKAKCSGDYPCRRCDSHGLECRFPAPRTTERAATTPEALISPASTHIEGHEPIQPLVTTTSPSHDSERSFELEQKDHLRNYIHTYFDKTDFLDCLFLHRATVLNEWSRGHLEPHLLKAICALGLRLMSPHDEDASSASNRWIDEVQNDLVTRIGDISIPNLQALVLVICFRSALKFSGDVWVLLSIAARVAFTKRLNYERSAVDAVTQESLRRLMWSIYRLDKVFSGGIEDLTVCPTSRLHMRLPNSHHNFQLGLRSSMKFLHDKDDTGADMNVFAYLMRMYDLRDRILRYTRRVILDGASPYTSREELHSLDRELISFKTSLPEDLQLNSERLIIMCHSEEARGYIVLHTLLYLCRCDLFRFLIPGIRESVSASAMEQTPRAYIGYCQQSCLESAVWCCEFWSHIGHAEMRHPVEGGTLTIALYQCIKIIDHLCFLLPPEGGHSLPQLKQKLWEALGIAARSQERCEWVGQCISDIEKLIPHLGTRERLSDTPPPPGTLSAQEKLHRRSKYAFAPADEEDVDPTVNPQRPVADETVVASAAASDAGAGSETWPFSMSRNGEAVEYTGSNLLGSAQFFGDALVSPDMSNQVASSFEDQDLTLSMDPFDLQMNAYTDANLPQFLGEIE
ncbi:hypothetical protein EDB81DRAFT_945868 [Dactylonectria macrodidyma]|uniref:Zn(2)-C6 fungal-type domain-containing protein n=1 Tax=Dactylonectria macrodidyma TaxID=307937 RepID=A0A9P9F1W1_9HYPO|nr:hypothetical protein EDB81DRAFT_945868 [Dactylonectria macrodidyma]